MSKYKKFQEKMKNIPINSGYSSKDVVALEYIQLLEEVLKEFKRLEDIVMEDIKKALYPEDYEDEVTNDDENCWVEYFPPID